MDPLIVGILGIIALVILLCVGIHVAVALGLTGIAGFIILTNVKGGLGLAGSTPYATMADFSFIVIPMFILMGQFIRHGGLAEQLYDACYKWFGRVPGGLAISTTASCALFGAASGSSLATAATFTTVSLPPMLKHGYDKRLASGAIAASGTLASMIPPSGLMVLYGIFTEQSIGKLLIAGILPGILTAIMYVTMVFSLVTLKPGLAPRARVSASWGEKLESLKGGLWEIVLMVVLVMGGLYVGVFTATEAGAVGASGSLLILVLKSSYKRKSLMGNIAKALLSTAQMTVTLLIMIMGAFIFGRFLAVAGLGTSLGNFLMGLQISPLMVVIAFLVMYILLGCFIEPGPMMAVTLPFVFPIVDGLGFDGIWFGVLMIKCCEIGLITPPVGLTAYTVQSVSEGQVNLEDVFRGVIPFFVADIFTMAILIAFPQISLCLPQMMSQ